MALNLIHYGHLSAAWQVLQTLQLQELRFMPCHRPPHRADPFSARLTTPRQYVKTSHS